MNVSGLSNNKYFNLFDRDVFVVVGIFHFLTFLLVKVNSILHYYHKIVRYFSIYIVTLEQKGTYFKLFGQKKPQETIIKKALK